jgi:alcohol dehydrogenase/S-(hydroxymethyl)glutathione dehydrogenase/alcohol dehydrogenase
MTQAAVLERVGTPLRLVEVDLEPPHAGEVEVEIAATGVCHSDVSVLKQWLPHPLPVVLGHEGAGVITAVGEGVVDVEVGDRVVLSWLAQCGDCFYCLAGQPQLCEKAGVAFARGTLMDGSTRFSLRGQPMYQMAGLGTFARRCVVPARSAIRIPESIPFTSAALIGCGVLTGWGAAVNTAAIGVGESVAVVGCGGVGLNAVQGAHLAGAGTIVAIDLHDERLDMARSLGATHVLRPGDGTARRVRDLVGGRGVDVALDVVGRPETIRDSISMTRRGGRVVLVGAAGDDVQLSLPAFTGVVMTEKVIRGSLYGSTHVRRDVPRLVQLYEAGRLKLDELVTAEFPFDDVNDAVEYCLLEKGARAVVTF